MKLFLDTSVFSAYYDERTPERMHMTRDFWLILQQHEKLCSELTIEELGQAHSKELRTIEILAPPEV